MGNDTHTGALDLREIFADIESFVDKDVCVEGWIRNHRRQKTFGFIDFFDGTCFKSLQVVYDESIGNFAQINAYRVGSAVRITGKLVRSQGRAEAYEIQAKSAELLGDCPEEYPLQPKRHSLEFLREIAYLRPRTRLFQAVFRLRSVASTAIHRYFENNGYVYVHTPLITGNDAEGAGNTFTVTSLDIESVKRPIDFSQDLFGRHTSLAVTGQLEAETFALAFKKVYTFGPTFRAENSNTKTHAAEFWMIEPEIAFCEINGLMDIEEDFLKFIVSYCLEHATDEIRFLKDYTKTPLEEKLNKLVASPIARVSYKEAIEILKAAKKDFEFKPEFGGDLAKEHEKYLTDEHFNSPVFVYDWPKAIKAFYMYQNDDNETVAAVDLLVPGAGELMGGSQRETRYDKLLSRMNELGISAEEMYWYLNLRKFGGCVHSGFGMGFERLLIYLSGMENIRDVIPYARTPQNCEF
ncbi:MAG: asparagine--tRNA ligase [Burkholderiales bacterium]